MTNAKNEELNLRMLNQVSGGYTIAGQHVNTPAQAAVIAHEIQVLTNLMTRHLPPSFLHRG